MLKPTNQELKSAVERVFDAISTAKRGDLIEHDTIAHLSGIAWHAENWGALIQKLNKRMERERGVSLVNDFANGYRLATIEEQLHAIPIKRQRKAIKQYTKALHTLRSTPKNKLTAHQSNVLAMRTASIKESRRIARKNLRQQEAQLDETRKRDAKAKAAAAVQRNRPKPQTSGTTWRPPATTTHEQTAAATA